MSEPEMSEPAAPPPAPPTARPRRRRISFVWLIPLIGVGLAAYFGYRTYLQQGPIMTLTFNTADGLSAGQTQVKYKAVAIGTVQGIDLSPDSTHVVVHVRMTNVGARFLTSNARFWVEGAHFSLTDLSSLGSVVTGAYIAVDPGKPGGTYRDKFSGLEGPPGVRSDEPGRTYKLSAGHIGALRTGSPVMFRDVNVGEVLGYDLGSGIGPVNVSIFVRAPFDDLVRPESRFWNSSGISFDMQPGAFRLEFASLAAVFSGGVAFDLPPQGVGSQPSPNQATFKLYDSREQAESASFADMVPVVSYFHSSVAGLKPGSPVQIYGIQVGVVTGISLVLDPTSGEEKVRVAMAVQPQRSGATRRFLQPDQIGARLQKMVDRGIRTEIISANLITGDKAISLVQVPDAKPAKVVREGDSFVLPGKSSDFDSIVSSLSDIADKLDKVPLKQIGDNLNDLIKSTNATIGSPQTRQAIAGLSASLASLNGTLTMLNQDYGSDSDFQRGFVQLLQQANAALAALQQFTDYLNRHPNALLFGRGSGR